MAALASTVTFIQQVMRVQSSQCPHVWITDGDLVFGQFPKATVSFKFSSETLVPSETEVGPINAAGRKNRISMLHRAKRVGERHEIETADAIYDLGSATHALTLGLELIETLVPGTLDKLSQEKKQSKRPVARSLEELYDLPKQRRYSEKIKSGHYVATNNKGAEARGVLRRAAQIAGLTSDHFNVRKRASA